MIQLKGHQVTDPSLSPQTSSYLDITPSPNKLLTDHPLSTIVKTEQQEEANSCMAGALVKHLADPDGNDLPAVTKVEDSEVLTDKVKSEESET